jgi:rhodanese-related sulfurtransferase
MNVFFKPKTTLQETVTIVFYCIVLAVGFNFLSGREINLFSKPAAIAWLPDSIIFNAHTAIPDSMADQSVSLRQLNQLIRTKAAVIIDARNPEAYIKAHIPGAINVPSLKMFDYMETLNSIPTESLIVVYCEGRNCELSSNLIKSMKTMNFKRIIQYKDGIESWEAAKYPVETGN